LDYQDMVAESQEVECELKYVIHIPGGSAWTSDNYTVTTHWDYVGVCCE
jgi:hypothetical protein